MSLANPAEWELRVLCSIRGGPSADDLQHADERERLDLVAFRLKRQGSPLRGKAAAEGQEQPRRSLDTDSPSKECPHDALLLGQEAEPGAAICGDVNIGSPGMPIFDLKSLVPNDDRRLGLLLPGKREVIRGVEACCLVALEHEGQPL